LPPKDNPTEPGASAAGVEQLTASSNTAELKAAERLLMGLGI
jgi:hypothetical protein